MDHQLTCQSCGATFSPGLSPITCPDCERAGVDGRLEVTPDLDTVDREKLPFTGGDYESSMWRYRELLPLFPNEPVSLGEGWTPITEAGRLSSDVSATVLLKNETVNPTWSFKDRLNSLLLSNAASDGYGRIATSSTGNHGASTAAYARAGGLEQVLVLLHPESDRTVRLQVRGYGAETVVTDAEKRAELLSELVERGWYPTTNTATMSAGVPYGYEGYKTIAYEIVEQLDDLPDAVLVPTGSGDGLYGIWKGFRELDDLGVIDSPPKMIAVQPQELAPMVEAFEQGSADVAVTPESPPMTTSTASDAVGRHALGALDASGGGAVAVSHEAIVEALGRAAADGVLLEPASALAPAGVSAALDDGVIAPTATAVCVGTGAGVKWPDSLEPIVGSTPTIEPTYESLAAAVRFPLED